MNFFKKMFGMFSRFFSRVAETAIGVAADSISATAIEIVGAIENSSDMSGVAKRNLAVDKIRERYPDIQTAAINLAIETAVAIVKEILKK